MPLKIAAKVDDVDQDYFDGVVKPLLAHPLVEYIGEIGDGEKQEFLGCAIGLLFPIDWEEPFGLVMIEALACGTPVVAFRRGSVPEVLADGETGFIVDDLADAIAAARRLPGLDRRRCRDSFERNFTVARMANDYVGVYERVIRRTTLEETA
jgi:glycosyltransferase involved in cell wall biosynthesis